LASLEDEMNDWLEVEEAQGLGGLRLVITASVPGPWGEAAKGVFRVKGIPFAKVRQVGGQENDALFAWTGHRNAPIAVYEDETPRVGWVEVLHLAERLAPEPALIPSDPADRALFFGLSHELMSEGGFGWCRRLMLFQQTAGDADEPPEALRPTLGRMFRQYGYSAAAARRAPGRVAEILGLLSDQLARQREAGHAYLMGAQPSALDLYTAAMLGIVSPLPEAQCAMPSAMRGMYQSSDDVVNAALDPALLAHRDLVYEKHMGLPVDL
jgi:glutathione S-transferase